MNDKKSDHEKMLDALLPETAQATVCRRLPAGRGSAWLREAVGLFRRAPGAWLLAIGVLLAIMLLLGYLRPFGDVLTYLLGPILNAGFMYYASRLAGGRMARVNDLFIGLRQQTAALVGTGVINLLSLVAMLVMVFTVAFSRLGQENLQALAQALEAENMEAIQALLSPHLREILLAVLVAMALYLPVMAALWFAAPLILLRKLGIREAMRLSLMACLRNMMPMLVYGLVVLGWTVLLSMALGILSSLHPSFGVVAVVVILPVLLCLLFIAQWVCFADIFAWEDSHSPPPPPPASGITQMTV